MACRKGAGNAMAYALLALAFAGGFLLIFGVNLIFADIKQSQQRQLRERLQTEARLLQQERARSSMEFRDAYEMAAEDAAVQHRKPWRERFALLVDQAGVKTKPGQILAVGLLLGVVGATGIWFLTGSIVAAVVVAPLAGCIPFLWVSVVRAQRLSKLQGQLPDAFELMARTMRAGQTVSQAFQAVADEAGVPLSEEFGYCYDQQNLGMSPEAAMHDLSRRTGLLEIKIFVLAVMIHRTSGGNLSELLEKLAHMIRERYRIQGMIGALTAEGKLQAYVLLALPIFLMCAMFFVNRPYIMQLFEFPLILLGMFTFMGLGALWMNRIINFDF